jgi:hypothetical protein
MSNSSSSGSDNTANEDFRVCAAQSQFSLEFEPPPFQVNAAIENMHTRSPRFGHANDINLLIRQDSSTAEKQDYLTGLLAGSFAVFCLFCVWMIGLCFLKCLGPSRVGFFSARRNLPVKPDKPEAVHRQERIRKLHPFQHNGEAANGGGQVSSDNDGGGGGVAKMILKPVVGVAKAPITMVSKARERKRDLERRSQFSRMNSGEIDHDGMDHQDETMEVLEEETLANGSSAFLTDSKEQAPPQDATRSSSEVLTEEDRKIIREYEQEWKYYEQLIHRGQDRIRRIRIGAGFCACGILISAILFTIMTQDSFTTSLEIFDSGLGQVNIIIDEVLMTSGNFAERQANARDSTRKLLLQINGTYYESGGRRRRRREKEEDSLSHLYYVPTLDICPDTVEQLCTNINDETATTADERGCDFSTVPYGTELASMVKIFDTTLTTVLEDIGGVEEDLVNLQDVLNQADLYFPKHGTWAFWTAAGCSLALGVVALLLTGGMVYIEMGQGQQANGRERKLPKVFSCCRSWLLIPLLFLLVSLSWILSMVFILMGIGSSDLCYNSPDIPVLNLLESIEDEFGSIIYPFLRYYVSACPAVDAPRELELAVQAIQEEVLPAMGNLLDAIRAQGELSIEETCGTGVAPFLAIVGALGNQLCVLGLTMVRTTNERYILGRMPCKLILLSSFFLSFVCFRRTCDPF